MKRPAPCSTLVVAALIAGIVVAAAFAHPGAAPSATWGSAFRVQDPDPGFWRPAPRASAADARAYSAGMSSLAAMTRLKVSRGHDLELTNLGSSGSLKLEDGGIVVTAVDGDVALHRAGESASHDPAPAAAGALLLRGDRLLFHSSATIALRNPEATSASLLLMTAIEAPPAPSQEMHLDQNDRADTWNSG